MKARAQNAPVVTVTPTAPRVSEKTLKARHEEEQLLLTTAFRFLKELGFGEDYDPSEKSAEGRSVEWLAMEIAERLDDVDSSNLSTSPKPPSGAESFYQRRGDLRHRLDTLENSVQGSRASRAFQDCHDEVFRFMHATERLFATIGFAIGVKAAAREFRRISDTIDQSVGAQYTIATPEPTEKQLQFLDDLARDVQWNAGEYEKRLEDARRGWHWRNRDGYVKYAAHLIKLKRDNVIS